MTLAWYQHGVVFAINGALFLAGILTIAALLAGVALLLLWQTRPLVRKTIAVIARRRAWRTHHTSGRR